MGLWTFYNLLRRPFRNNSSAFVSAFRSHIDNIIRCFNDIQIVFNDNDCIAVRRQSSENLGQLMDIRKMKSCRRLIQNVDSLPGTASLIRCASPPDSVVEGCPRRI